MMRNLTYTGMKIDWDAPRSFVRVPDIAHALANQAMFYGHTTSFYSKAQHCVELSLLLEERGAGPTSAMIGLLSRALDVYGVPEGGCGGGIWMGFLDALGVVCEDTFPDEVLAARTALTASEVVTLFRVVADPPPAVVRKIRPLQPRDAERVWLERYECIVEQGNLHATPRVVDAKLAAAVR